MTVDLVIEALAEGLSNEERSLTGTYSWAALSEAERGHFRDSARNVLRDLDAAGFFIAPKP